MHLQEKRRTSPLYEPLTDGDPSETVMDTQKIISHPFLKVNIYNREDGDHNFQCSLDMLACYDLCSTYEAHAHTPITPIMTQKNAKLPSTRPQTVMRIAANAACRAIALDSRAMAILVHL